MSGSSNNRNQYVWKVKSPRLTGCQRQTELRETLNKFAFQGEPAQLCDAGINQIKVSVPTTLPQKFPHLFNQHFLGPCRVRLLVRVTRGTGEAPPAPTKNFELVSLSPPRKGTDIDSAACKAPSCDVASDLTVQNFSMSIIQICDGSRETFQNNWRPTYGAHQFVKTLKKQSKKSDYIFWI